MNCISLFIVFPSLFWYAELTTGIPVNRNYYEILGVEKTATDQEIKKAFRRMAKKYHPDRNKAKDAEQKFRDIAQAYEMLSGPGKRDFYDQTMGSAHQSEHDENSHQTFASDFHAHHEELLKRHKEHFEAHFKTHFGGDAEKARDFAEAQLNMHKSNNKKRCYTVTKVVGGTVTTYTHCSY